MSYDPTRALKPDTPRCATHVMISVQTERETVLRRHALRPLQDRNRYTCTGPDGTQFVQTNKRDLTSLLRSRYGADVVILWMLPPDVVKAALAAISHDNLPEGES